MDRQVSMELEFEGAELAYPYLARSITNYKRDWYSGVV